MLKNSACGRSLEMCSAFANSIRDDPNNFEVWFAWKSGYRSLLWITVSRLEARFFPNLNDTSLQSRTSGYCSLLRITAAGEILSEPKRHFIAVKDERLVLLTSDHGDSAGVEILSEPKRHFVSVTGERLLLLTSDHGDSAGGEILSEPKRHFVAVTDDRLSLLTSDHGVSAGGEILSEPKRYFVAVKDERLLLLTSDHGDSAGVEILSEPKRHFVSVTGERLLLLTSDHGDSAGGEILSEPKRHFVANTLTVHRSIVMIWLKCRWSSIHNQESLKVRGLSPKFVDKAWNVSRWHRILT